ncbi:ADP-ribosylation factor-like protein 5A isoform X1, partial [Arapaima gigas]
MSKRMSRGHRRPCRHRTCDTTTAGDPHGATSTRGPDAEQRGGEHQRIRSSEMRITARFCWEAACYLLTPGQGATLVGRHGPFTPGEDRSSHIRPTSSRTHREAAHFNSSLTILAPLELLSAELLTRDLACDPLSSLSPAVAVRTERIDERMRTRNALIPREEPGVLRMRSPPITCALPVAGLRTAGFAVGAPSSVPNAGTQVRQQERGKKSSEPSASRARCAVLARGCTVRVAWGSAGPRHLGFHADSSRGDPARLRAAMGILFTKLWRLFNHQEHKVIIVGLDNAGKTTILYQFSMNEVVHTSPTIGSNVEEIMVNNTHFLMWDIGGQESLRSSWNTYYTNTEFVIVVVDSTDRERIYVTREELCKMLAHEDLKKAGLLVFANKQDVKGCMTVAEISQSLQLTSVKDHQWHIQACCALTGEGLCQGLEWMMSRLRV